MFFRFYLSLYSQILLQLEKHEIHIYDFPASEVEPEHHWMRGRLPFAVVGSNTMVMDREGNMCRGREYPWGNVNIEDKVVQLEYFVALELYPQKEKI